VVALAIVAAGCGSGGAGDPDLESFLKWEPGDYRTLAGDFCQLFAQDAGSLVPSKEPPTGGSHEHQATCHWSTIGKRFRELSLLVTLDQPDPIDHVPAVAVASRGFNQLVGLNRKGLPLEEVRDVRPVTGLGDQAMLIYGVVQDDHAVIQIVMRQRNIEVTVTVQASDTKYVTASDGSGVYPVTTPLSEHVVQSVAVASGRHVLGLLPPQAT
jgi:hypothetical protein